MNESKDSLKAEVSGSLRDLRERVRSESTTAGKPSAYPAPPPQQGPLESLRKAEFPEVPVSPSRESLNELWDLWRALETPLNAVGPHPHRSPSGDSAPAGGLRTPPGILRGLLRRVLRFAWGPLIDRQVQLNSDQVRFDNELVGYIDRRLDAISAHYDHMLGLYGKRMEEIDERHLILQQELIRHVHELVKRMDFVFETAEQNHLYLEGMLREAQEELREIARRMEALSASSKR